MDEQVEEKLEPPTQFDFPFIPYSIQHEFMANLYHVLENRRLGIFESPTGTGKSLSIICGALRWLRDHNEHLRNKLVESINKLEAEKQKLSADTSDWLNTQAKEIELNSVLGKLKLEQRKILDYDKKIENLKSKQRTKKHNKWVKVETTEGTSEVAVDNEVDDEDIILEDLVPGINDESDEDEEDEDKYRPVQIYICSRTHSQLSQFVGEIIKSPFGGDTRTISFASRQNYCINPNVTRLRNAFLMNERCLELQKNKNKSVKTDTEGKVVKRKKGSSCQCPFYKQQNIDDLKDFALLNIQDVEDLATAGKQLNACPYYATRKAAEDANIVLVPYNTLLHKPTREANGIKLKGNIIIIDEAHNLLEALAQMHNSSVNYDQLYYAHLQLKNYKQKYCTRFSSRNLLCINQLIFVIKKLLDLLDIKNKESKSETEIYSIHNFVFTAGIDNYNMFKLIDFCKNSKISQKLHSFALKCPQTEPTKNDATQGAKSFLQSIENKPKSKSKLQNTTNVAAVEDSSKPIAIPSNPLLSVISFLESLNYSCDDGRVLFLKNESTKHSKFQFLLLNPAVHFKEIVENARAVVVAGGTMKPNAEFRDRLFVGAGAAPDRIVEFSCDHIIPSENILPIILTKGPRHEPLLFNYENRLSMGGSLKQIIKEACKSVKGGIVVFFPSYKYEAWFWQQIEGFVFNRKIFREPQDSSAVDSVLNAYADAVHKSSNGAMLFSVVGGKLSEGLNFSDDLGRCVIVVGMPYANIKAADLKEKMSYLDKNEGAGAGQKFYENLCLKAVNQCIGRAVRHSNDYASVLLLDERYNRVTTKNALPGWIKRSLETCDFYRCFGLIEEFFRKRSTI